MKKLLIILSIVALLGGVLAAVALVKIVHAVVEEHPQSHSELKQQAESAIRDVGGADPLEKEAKSVLSNQGSSWRDIGTNCPAITKVDFRLNPLKETDSWVVTDRQYLPNLPAHVVIRFGSHAHYAYVWIFDPSRPPPENTDGVEHLGGAVYLSEENQ